MLQAFGMKPVQGVPPLKVPGQFRLRMDRMFDELRWTVKGEAKPMIGIAPGAAYGSAKRWPIPHVATLVLRLIDAGFRPVFLGAKNDVATVQEVEDALAAHSGSVPVAGEHYLNLAGKTELAQLMAVMLEMHAVVSNDSGAMHLASALDRPVVAIFGPTDEQVTSPIGPYVALTHDVTCRPCMLRECPIDHRCLRDLLPDTVFDAVLRVQKTPRRAATSRRQRDRRRPSGTPRAISRHQCPPRLHHSGPPTKRRACSRSWIASASRACS